MEELLWALHEGPTGAMDAWLEGLRLVLESMEKSEERRLLFLRSPEGQDGSSQAAVQVGGELASTSQCT